MPDTLTPSTPGKPAAEKDPGGDNLIDRVADTAQADAVSDEERVEALDWLLADENDPKLDAIPTKVLELNVGTEVNPKWIEWKIQAITEDEIKSIRRMSAGNRAQRRGGVANDDSQDEFNLRVATAGTTSPDLMALATKRGIADPATALRMRFRRKWGLITLLAGEVVTLSGVDDEALREGREIRAALD